MGTSDASVFFVGRDLDDDKLDTRRSLGPLEQPGELVFCPDSIRDIDEATDADEYRLEDEDALAFARRASRLR